MVLAGTIERCIAGGINAGGTAQGIHHQAAVIRKAGHAGKVPEILNLYNGILLESRAGLLDIDLFFCKTKVVGGYNLDAVGAEDFAGFAEFSGVAGGEKQFHINGLSRAVRRASS